MRTRIKKLLFLSTLGGILFGFLAHQAVAIQIVPSRHVYTLKKGKKTQGFFTLTNTEPGTITVMPEAKNWVSAPGNEDINATDWLDIDKSTFTLKYGESKEIGFTAYAPKKAKGEVAAMASFLTKREGREAINLRISAAVYMAVKKTEVYGSEVHDISISLGEKHIDVALALKNTGNVHVRPRGVIDIRDKNDKNVAYVKIGKGGPVYPGQVRIYQANRAHFPLPPGQYRALVFIKEVDRGVEVIKDWEVKFNVKKGGRVKVRK